jgi:hypothetical protein
LIDVYKDIAKQSNESRDCRETRGFDVSSSNLSHLLHGTRDGVANVVLF